MQPFDDYNSSGVWTSVGSIVSQHCCETIEPTDVNRAKTGMEKSNRLKAKILQRNLLVVKMGSLQAAPWAKWGSYKISSGGRSRETRPKHCTATMQDLLSDPESLVNLKLELAVIIEVGEHFVKATYFLEGDGPLVFSCYEKLQAVAEACQLASPPPPSPGLVRRRTFQMCVQW